MTDLKPGQIVQHPKHGNGIVYREHNGHPGVLYSNLDAEGRFAISNLTGWTPADTLPAGHVAVKVDDIDLGPAPTSSEAAFVESTKHEFPEYSVSDLKLIYRALKAMDAQPAEPTDFAARVTVDGQRWCRQHDGYWASDTGDLHAWVDLCALGTVTLGWPQDATDGDLPA